MSFLEYMKDKRYFWVFYFVIMTFVTLIMFLGGSRQEVGSNILYINITCFFFAVLYTTIGYFYRRNFFQQVTDVIESQYEDISAMLPKAQNYQQKRFLDLLKKIHHDYTNELRTLYDEKREHQEFIISWIHEVKLPIAACHLLIENSDEQSVEILADKFEDELNKIEDYVEQALYYSRIDSFSKDYFIKEVHVNQIIKNSVKKYAKLFISKGIHFNLESKEQYVQSDSKWLGFVIDQIIANSLKYTDENGKITIQFDEDSKEKRLIIEDNGIGIKPEDLNRVFERGFTGTIGRNYAKSTGIGLYLAKQLANKLGHDISIQSEEYCYTRVIVHFPKMRNYYKF
jgi:signal transduction histidine kinase